jgi:hypothetical protein
MRNSRLHFFLKVLFKWLWLAVRFKSLQFKSLDIDQGLLFEGSSCLIIWDIRGAYLVKLYRDGKKIGSCLPNECPVILVWYSSRLEIKACGVYRHIGASLALAVRELKYRNAAGALLKKSHFLQPPVVKEFLLRLKYQQPVTPQPVIQLDEISLDTPYMKQLETALQERITQYQIIAEKPKPYFYGNELL